MSLSPPEDMLLLSVNQMRALCLLFAFSGTLAAQIVEMIESPVPSVHASTVVELKNGELLSAWFGGTKEGAPDVAIWMSRRTATGWSKAVEAVREPEIAAYNPVLFHSADGVLWLYYKFGPSPGTWSAGRKFSRDEGLTWSAVEHLPAGLYGPIRAKPLVLADGTILSGTSVESYGSWACWIERSVDNAKSWTRIGPIAAPLSLAAGPVGKGAYGVIQPSLLDLGKGHIRLYARSTNSIAHICQADSLDRGFTWSKLITTELPNNNSGIDAVRLRDGRLIMIFNNTTQGRTPLNLAVSGDEGKSWKVIRDLETEPGEYSYPALIEAKNGDLLMTYTYQRKSIKFRRLAL